MRGMLNDFATRQVVPGTEFEDGYPGRFPFADGNPQFPVRVVQGVPREVITAGSEIAEATHTIYARHGTSVVRGSIFAISSNSKQYEILGGTEDSSRTYTKLFAKEIDASGY